MRGTSARSCLWDVRSMEALRATCGVGNACGGHVSEAFDGSPAEPDEECENKQLGGCKCRSLWIRREDGQDRDLLQQLRNENEDVQVKGENGENDKDLAPSPEVRQYSAAIATGRTSRDTPTCFGGACRRSQTP